MFVYSPSTVLITLFAILHKRDFFFKVILSLMIAFEPFEFVCCFFLNLLYTSHSSTNKTGTCDQKQHLAHNL